MEDETIRDSVFEEEDDQKKKRSDDSKDNTSASTHHVSSTAVAQTIAVSFVALIVVTGVIIPVIENSANEASAFIDCMIYTDELSVYGYVSPYSENENYVLIIYQDGAEIHRETMMDGHVSFSLYVNSYSTYKAEIRSGTPPLLLLASQEAKRV